MKFQNFKAETRARVERVLLSAMNAFSHAAGRRWAFIPKEISDDKALRVLNVTGDLCYKTATYEVEATVEYNTDGRLNWQGIEFNLTMDGFDIGGKAVDMGRQMKYLNSNMKFHIFAGLIGELRKKLSSAFRVGRSLEIANGGHQFCVDIALDAHLLLLDGTLIMKTKQGTIGFSEDKVRYEPTCGPFLIQDPEIIDRLINSLLGLLREKIERKKALVRILNREVKEMQKALKVK